MLNRRTLLAATAGTVALPSLVGAQAANTLKITGWGGRWGEIMRDELIPAFERENRCRVEVDTAFPFVPKLLASPRGRPVYDVLHTNSNEQWDVYARGLVEKRPDLSKIPNAAAIYPYATSDDIVGVVFLTSAVGLAYRRDKVQQPPVSWKDLWDARFSGNRGSYLIPANSLGQMLFMMAGKLYGSGYRDLNAAFAAMERLRPVRLFDFTGGIENAMLSGELNVGVLHDTAVYRNQDRVPVEFVSPTEGVFALEQVLSICKGTQMTELANTWINYMLSPTVQMRMSTEVWYSPVRRDMQLPDRFRGKLLTTPEQVASLIQFPWEWYNQNKDRIDDRVNRIFRG
ncbi:extracellular solute-binding protein [Falsiroseomonas sp. HW251]|uniref:extracellular solute-binding protein n=1 Tax=Falsiroseomonas sp. HW251 TaxID=3390998 RepID=UPI003D312ACB